MAYENPTLDLVTLKSPSIFYLDDKTAIFVCTGSPEGAGFFVDVGTFAISDNGSWYKKTTGPTVDTGFVEVVSGTVTDSLTISGANPTLNLVDTTGGDSDGALSMQADLFNVTVDGGTPIQFKSNGFIIGVERVLPGGVSTTITGNVGAGLDTLRTFSLPANTLAADGDIVKARYGFAFANAAANKQVVLSFGGTAYENVIGAVAELDVTQGTVDVEIIRVSATSVRISTVTVLGQLYNLGAATAIAAGPGAFNAGRNALLTGLADLNANATILLVTGQTSTVNNDEVICSFSRISAIQNS